MDRRIKAQQQRQQHDTPDARAWRLKHNAVLARVRAEMAERYPTITAENVDAALRYQAERIDALMGK